MQEVSLLTLDGAAALPGWFAPASSADAPGLILIQEIFGVNASMRAAARQWAAHGYNVIVPDLFWRQEVGVQLDPTDPAQFQRGRELMSGMDSIKTLDDLEAARRWLADCIGHERVGALGYCLGGRLAVQVASHLPVQAAVSYYGVNLEKLVPELPASAAPLLLHIAGDDSFVPPAAQATILAAAERHGQIDVHVYPGVDHGFARPNGMHWDEAAAQLAEQRSLAFLRGHGLGELGAD